MLKLERAREQITLSRCEERLKFTIKQLLEHRTDMKISYCFDCGMPWKCYACGADFVAMAREKELSSSSGLYQSEDLIFLLEDLTDYRAGGSSPFRVF